MKKTITVKGKSQLSIAPDTIELAFSLKAEDKVYEEAFNQAKAYNRDLKKHMIELGFKDSDLKTSQFYVNSEYDNVKDEHDNYQRQFRAFVCYHELKLSFDVDMERLAAVLAAMAKASSQPEISIRFLVKNSDAIYEELLKAISRNAKDKAKILVGAMNHKLGDLISIDYNWNKPDLYAPVRYEMNDRLMAAKAMAMDISPEDIEISDTATFVWEIA